MADILRPFDEIAKLAREMKVVRDAGFTEEALRYPRSHEGLIALCAFNGIKPSQAPPGWHYWPNKSMMDCWNRVIAALREEWFVDHYEHLLCEAREVIRETGGGDRILNDIDEVIGDV